MNKSAPSLQAAVVTGLNILNDPDVRVSASQAEGLVSLRVLLQGLASGQLVVTEPSPTAGDAVKKQRAPRRTKAQMAQAKANGAAAPTPAAAPATVQ